MASCRDVVAFRRVRPCTEFDKLLERALACLKSVLARAVTLLHAFIADVGWREMPPASVESELGRENWSP